MDYSEVDAEVEAGRLWRAKEILQGRLRQQHTYDSALFRRYGEILLEMGDDLEAGKYLLLGAKSFPINSKAVDLFLNKWKNSTAFHLWGSMPKSAKYSIPEESREVLIAAFTSIDLNSDDIDAVMSGKEHQARQEEPTPRNAGDYMLMIIAVGIVVIGLRACAG